MKISIFAFLFLTIAIGSFGQSSVIQDSKGETALALPGSNVVAINTKNESISLSINAISRLDSSWFNYWGVSFQTKAKEGVASAFKDGEFLLDGEFGLYLGFSWNDFFNNAVDIYVSPKLIHSRSKLFDPDRNPDDQVFDQTYTGWKIEAGANGFSGHWIYGASFNITQTDNSDQISSQTIFRNLTTASNGTVYGRSQNAFSVADYKEGLVAVKINVDIGKRLNKVNGSNPAVFGVFHIRAESFEDKKPEYNPGLGVYLSKKGAPREIVSGFNLQAIDIFNGSGHDKSMSETIVYSIVAGYTF